MHHWWLPARVASCLMAAARHMVGGAERMSAQLGVLWHQCPHSCHRDCHHMWDGLMACVHCALTAHEAWCLTPMMPCEFREPYRCFELAPASCFELSTMMHCHERVRHDRNTHEQGSDRLMRPRHAQLVAAGTRRLHASWLQGDTWSAGLLCCYVNKPLIWAITFHSHHHCLFVTSSLVLCN